MYKEISLLIKEVIMGLIRAAAGAIGGTLADQWKDYFYCDAIDADTLVVKGQKRVSKRSSNTKGESNVISDGAGIAVADGQCMMIVEQGKVIELCAEPGVFTYNNKTSPSIFSGDLKEGLKGAARDAWERFTFGGGAGKDQRIYYFNTKEIIGNKYGTINPIPFKVMIDKASNMSLPVDVRCNGEYSYRIINPMLFYTTVCANIGDSYERSEIDSQLKSELMTKLQHAFAKVAAMGVDYSEIPLHTETIAEALNEALTPQWSAGRGIEVVSFGVNSVTVTEEDKLKIQNLQQSIIMSDVRLAAGNLNQAQADAMRMAASNESGAVNGFMGMNMAAMSGGMNQNELFDKAQQIQQNQTQPVQQPSPNAWTCQCGNVSEGKFCTECGAPRPAAAMGWTCVCGTLNKGKFCMECGAKKPAEAILYKCDKCGWEPEDPEKPPKFCPECGDIFDENDVKG
jgi:membrane protease subunit (stomatin/prohibitin family)